MSGLEGAKSEAAAAERNRYHLQRSLAVLTHNVWVYGETERPGAWWFRTSPESVELRTAAGGRLYLTAAMSLTVERVRRGILKGAPFSGYKAKTAGYAYSIGVVANPEQALLAWHWHPPDPRYTHAHVYVRDETLGNVGKLHLPSSRVFFEQIVGFLIVGLGVEPLDEDWRSVIKDVSDRVDAAATWKGARP